MSEFQVLVAVALSVTSAIRAFKELVEETEALKTNNFPSSPNCTVIDWLGPKVAFSASLNPTKGAVLSIKMVSEV